MTSISLQGMRGYQRFALANTLTKAIWDRLLVTVLVGLGVGAMGLSMGPMFLALEDTIIEMMDQFPEDILAFAGGADMGTPAGWYTGELYSIMVPFAVLWVAAASAARAFGGEIENRTIGVVMSTPVRRTRLAVDKVVAMVVHVLLAAGLIGLMVWIGIVATGIDVQLNGVIAVSLMLSLLAIFVGGVSMVISIVTARGNLAVMLAMLLGVVMYAWSSFVPLANAIAELAWLSPWHHYIATEPMATGVDWASAALLAILAIVPLVVSVYLFKRRDIPG